MPTISGIVRDSAGNPIAGRVVRAYRRDSGDLLAAGASSNGSGNSDPQFSNVSLLLHGNGGNLSTTFTDSSADARTITIDAGSPTIETAQSKFGGASIRIPSGARIRTAANMPARLDVGINGGTIEFFVRFNSFTAPRSHIIGSWLSNAGWTIDLNSNTGIFFSSNGAGTSLGGINLSTGTWYHMAFVFRGTSGNTIDFWLDGAFIGTATRSTPTASTSQYITIGARSDNALALDAWIDELRITAAARYTAGLPINVPTQEFPDVTGLLPLGQFQLSTTYAGACTVVVLDEDAGNKNALVFDRVTPV